MEAKASQPEIRSQRELTRVAPTHQLTQIPHVVPNVYCRDPQYVIIRYNREWAWCDDAKVQTVCLRSRHTYLLKNPW